MRPYLGMSPPKFLIRILFLLFITVQGAVGQSREIDSLTSLLREENSDVKRIHLLMRLFEASRSNALKALEYANESVELAGRVGSDSLLFRSHGFLGNAYQYLGNYPKALHAYQTAIVFGQKLTSKTLLSQPYGNIGIIYYYQHDYVNALKYYERALQQLPSNDSIHERRELIAKSSLLSNIGIIYDETKKFPESEKYYKEALVLAKRASGQEMIANILNNQGTLFKDRGNNELAFRYMQEAMDIRKQNNNKFGMARSYLNLGQFYFENLNDYKKAEEYLRQAISMAQEVGSLETVNSSYNHLHKLYQQKGNYESAYEALRNFHETKDSLFNEENSKRITQLEMQFEFDRKQAQMEADQKAKELYFWMSAGGLVLLLIIVTLLFFLQRSRTKRSELEQVRLGLEKINLKSELTLKDKELATNIMYLINKNELINTISEKLLDIKGSLVSESQSPIQKIILELQSNLQPELWKEFEFRFQQVHEQFYRSLIEKFPDLTPSERRLCAFLKLNMTTKEISALTHQNAKSIDVARTRLRKKLSLTGTDHNLITFLESLNSVDSTQTE